MSKKLWLTSAAAATLMAAAAPSAFAQALEEIVVTARKKEERLQDTPLSITAFSARDLQERGLNDMLKVSSFSPGFQFESFGGRRGNQGNVSRPVIRGQSNILGDGNAAFFVDGVLFSDTILSFPFELVERVEIVRGPQAAQFGRSTLSGAINLVTKQPSDEPEHAVSLRAAQYNDYEVNAVSRGPLIEDKLFYMLHGRWFDFGGQYRNRLDGARVGQQSSKGVNGAIEFRATDALTARLNIGYNKDDDGPLALVLQERFANNCFLNAPRQYYCGPVQRRDSTELNLNQLRGEEGVRRHSTRIFGTIAYDADAFVITSNTGAFFTYEEFGYDADLTSADPTNLVVPRTATDPIRLGSFNRLEKTRRNEWSTELRVASAEDQPIRWVIGGFLYERRRTLVENHFLPTAPPIDFGTDRVNNKAVFGSVSGDLTDALTFTAELRYASDEIGNFQRARITTIPGSNGLLQNTFESWLPRFTVDYRLSESSMLYGVVAKGNKPGAINSDPRTPPAIRFADEESAWNYEIGTKNTFLDGRLIANLALYYIDWSKQQLTSAFDLPGGGTAPFLLNAGSTTSKGFEVELNAAVTERLTTGASYAFNDATFKELNDSEARELFGNPSVRGNQTPNSSRHQFAAFARYEHPLTDALSLVTRVDVSYASKKYDQVFNLAHTGDRTLVNAKIGVEGENWELTFFVDNLTDDRTPSTVVRFVDLKNLNVAPNANPAQNNVPGTTTQERGFQYPLADKRKFGITARYRF